MKKNKKVYDKCVKCGKPLSKSEIEDGVSKCENCLGRQAKNTKGILKGIGAGAGALASILIFVATKGKRK